QWVDTQMRRWRIDSVSGRSRSVAKPLGIVVLMSLLLVLPIGGFAWAYITWVLPEDYLSARSLILPLGLAVVTKNMSRVFTSQFVAQSRRGLATTIEVSALVVSVLMFFILTSALGAVGTAWGMVAGAAASLGMAVLAWLRRPRPDMVPGA